jgi:hypothetical protein
VFFSLFLYTLTIHKEELLNISVEGHVRVYTPSLVRSRLRSRPQKAVKSFRASRRNGFHRAREHIPGGSGGRRIHLRYRQRPQHRGENYSPRQLEYKVPGVRCTRHLDKDETRINRYAQEISRKVPTAFEIAGRIDALP